MSPAADGTVTWRELARSARASLEGRGLPDAAIDVRRMIEHATGIEPVEYLDVLEQPATVRTLAHFDAMLERRAGGEPLQYVLGRWAFRRLDLLVDRRVLIPRPETESLVEVALREADRLIDAYGYHYERRLPVADLGTGSGAIALAVATERTSTDVWGTDVSDDALAVARANLAGAGRAAARVNLRAGSWFEALPDGLAGSLGVIVSNPPYVATTDPLPDEVERWEPSIALRSGEDGLDAARVLFADAPGWLRPDGALVLELAPAQMDAAEAHARAAGFVSVDVHPDLTGRRRCLVARVAG
ncbi:MAG: peptide chain release factor N(5)-glutamine methyltransferase [Acidimicrobiales bacterium]|nr:peptide chain release factor N(5)-glutamine methyltransferase [Acidimicrobiales bacterium]